MDIKKGIPGKILTSRIRLIMIAFIIFFSVGIAGLAIEATRTLFISLTPLALLLSVAAIAAFHRPVMPVRESLVFAIIFLSGFLIEAFGTNTGKIFGHYTYLEGLGPGIFNTPLLIGVNWVVLVYCTAAITERIPANSFLRIPTASTMMVAYDVIMEIVAPEMRMWEFANLSVPLKNYAAWFTLSFAFHSLLKICRIRITNRIAPFIFFVQASFFIILVIIFKVIR